MFLPIDKPIIDCRNHVSTDETDDETIGKPDQTSQKGNAITNEVLSKKTQMGTHQGLPFTPNSWSFEDEPVGRKEDCETKQNPRHEALDFCIQVQKSG